MMKGKPLLGKKILITRARDQSSGFAKKLNSLGADVVEVPTIEIAPPASWNKVDMAIKKLDKFDWLIFTSVNGVRFFFQRLIKKGDIKLPPPLKICAIGPATAKEIMSYGIRVDYIPKEFVAESILKGFEKKDIKDKRILIARAKKARDILPAGLQKIGASVEVIETYRTVKPKGLERRLKKILKEEKIDVITFTSSSTVSNFIKFLKGIDIKEVLKNTVIACIGPITSKTAREFGLSISIQPNEFTITGLTNAIVQYFKNKKAGRAN